MKTISVLLALMVSSISIAQKKETFYDFQWKPTENPGKYRYYSVVEPKDSLWLRKDYYVRERKLHMVGNYLDKNIKFETGEFRYYHANGNLQSVGSYELGKRHGLWLRYYDNGMMQDSIEYEYGKITGIAYGWHRNGYMADSTIYNKDESGLEVTWFDNGVPSSAGVFAAGRKAHGKWKYFHKNGELSAEEVYDKGTLISKQYYDEGGNALADTTSRDSQAIFRGGGNDWIKYLYRNAYFPPRYTITGADETTVVVNWTVDEDGKVVDVFVSCPFLDFDSSSSVRSLK